MTLTQFAKLSGIRIVECGKDWGGKYGYIYADRPNITNCGYNTHKEAYKAWLIDSFGDAPAKALLKLLGEKNVVEAALEAKE